jgi:hypothetical protein
MSRSVWAMWSVWKMSVTVAVEPVPAGSVSARLEPESAHFGPAPRPARAGEQMSDQEGEVFSRKTRVPVKPMSAGPESARPASADSWPCKPETVSVGPISAIRTGSDPTGGPAGQ